MKYTNIKLKEIKKYFKFNSASTRYHNKHKNKSGNFGTNLTKGTWGQTDYENFDLSGEYDHNGELYILRFGEAYRGLGYTLINKRDDISRVENNEDLIRQIAQIIQMIKQNKKESEQ